MRRAYGRQWEQASVATQATMWLNAKAFASPAAREGEDGEDWLATAAPHDADDREPERRQRHDASTAAGVMGQFHPPRGLAY